MKNAPILAQHDNKAEKREDRLCFKVYGGLHYIRGNSSPYFSLTCWGWDGGSEFGGCSHETILKHFPQFADLAALHLSQIDGAPCHDASNALYYLGGCRHPKEICNMPAANYEHAASHLRITQDEARALVANLFGDHYSEAGGFLSKGSTQEAKARLNSWIDTQRPRWKAEAEACVKKHGLVVYGDTWNDAAA